MNASLNIHVAPNVQNSCPESEWSAANILTALPRGLFSVITDLTLLPIAGLALAISTTAKIRFDPASPKTNKPPILLLHGSGFNETEWIVGRQFLQDDQYGSVFSLNYDGLLSNDPQKGIDDYAGGKVRDKILEIQKRTGLKEVIIIGHSMGGLIAGCYAEEFSEKDGIAVNHVFSIGSPWKGAPALDYVEKYSKFGKKDTQMKVENVFLKTLVSKCLESESIGKRKYYSIGSTTDFMVPAPYSNLTSDPKRQRTFTYLGHYGLIASPAVWSQIRSWLTDINPKVSFRNN